MSLRESTHNSKAYKPQSDVGALLPGTYYLVEVDDKYRRTYARKPLAA